MKSTLSSLWKWLRFRWKQLLRWPLSRRLAVAVPLIGLAVWIVASDISSDRAWPAAAFLLIGLLALVIPTDSWQRFLSRVENAQLGPVGLGLRQEVERAAEIAPPSDKGEGAEAETRDENELAESAFELRMQLEWKLAFIAKHLLDTGNRTTFVTIGSLRFDGYLTESEARTATGIMLARDEELRELPQAERDKFVKDAQTFLDGLRAAVFWGRVKRELQGKDGAGGKDLTPAGVEGTGGRHDLLTGSADGEVRIIPILAINPESDKLENAIKPIEANDLPRPKTKRQIIVIPDTSQTQEPPESKVRVIKLSQLREELQAV